MTERWSGGHPELDLLADHLAETLAPAESTRLGAHLAGCRECRLELAQLARFQQLEDDPEAAREADWERARAELDRAYTERLRPALGDSDTASPAAETAGHGSAAKVLRMPNHRAVWLRWAVPVAAAAAVTVLVFGGDFFRTRGTATDSGVGSGLIGPVRGAASDSVARVEPLRPVGDIAAAPDTFTWRADDLHETYVLEIYTADLETVFRSRVLTRTHLVVPDSLRVGLKTDRTYLWNVQARDGLAVTATSPEVWFRIQR